MAHTQSTGPDPKKTLSDYFQAATKAHLEIARHDIDPSSCTGGTHMHKL